MSDFDDDRFDGEDVAAITQAAMKGLIMGLLVVFALMTAGCSTTETAEAEEDMTPRFSYEVVTDDTWMYTDVVIDTETGCQYLLAGDGDGYGLTLLVDKYGNPLLAQGYSRNEVGISNDDGE